ncbi:MAG TPA: DUF2203 domain-containing protein [Pyrinomonadaceae bacterium]|jgi:hypothetical protein|nr:DUF2203 domain-containing protein [Pyrinomonadaceae bacterium]
MKLFTIDEANALVSIVAPKLESIQRLYARIDLMRDDARAAAAASGSGGGMQGGTSYVNTLYRIGKLTTEIYEEGVEIKDPSRGLIDFPHMRNGRVVLLCWHLGEAEEIAWWHETDAGFAGRQPL